MADVQREVLAHELEELEPSAALWVEVIRRALDDCAYLLEKEGQTALKPSVEGRLREIRDDDPVAFFEGPWFEEICDYLGLAPDSIRPPAEELRRLHLAATDDHGVSGATGAAPEDPLASHRQPLPRDNTMFMRCDSVIHGGTIWLALAIFGAAVAVG
jgi:hypothetical protein